MEATWHTEEILGIDLETTGVLRHGDVPVSFGLVYAHGGTISRRISGLVNPGREIPPEAVAIHGITTERAREEGRRLGDALVFLADVLLDCGQRGVPVVGMNVSYDLSILDHQLRLLDGTGLAERGWSGPVLDVLVLDRHFDRYRRGKRQLGHLCATYSVEAGNAHEAGADAEAAVLVLLALCERFPEMTTIGLEELTSLQVSWHRAWAEDYDSWRLRSALTGLEAGDFAWPVARSVTAPLSLPT